MKFALNKTAMHFRTQISIPKSTSSLDYNSIIVSLGSCFAVNMAEKLNYFKFRNSCNPFGILFHPLAIEKLVDFAVSEKRFSDEDVFFHNGLWHCFDAHSDLSSPNKEELIATLNSISQKTRKDVAQASHIIITYGTAWVYRYVETKQIVANCHKIPQKQFAKELLSVETIQKSIVKTLALIADLNPDCTIIFTVSPVRHIKDGFVENQWSKANLIAAIHNILNTENGKYNVAYFPSYEIMMDELRDYRFYAEDMLHPSRVAIDYIWKRFVETTVSESAIATMEAVDGIQKSLLHRPFNPDSESHLKFESKVKEKITILENEYSFMKF